VLLLHGFPDDLHLWHAVAPTLVAAGFSTIAFDQRGFGDSDAPTQRQDYAIDRLVGDAADLLLALDVASPVHLIGHDWGAAVAWCLAIARPDLVRSAVTISVGHPTAYARAGFEQKLKGLYTIGWQFPGIAERWLRSRDWTPMRHWLRQHPDPATCVRGLSRPGRLTAGLNWYRANLRSMLLTPWPACRVPVLGVIGGADHCLTEAQMRDSGARVQAPWRYEDISGAGHWLPLTHPDRIADLAIDWFRQH
jgi:pimeloyl-ACP methyl ester carboxylesterase